MKVKINPEIITACERILTHGNQAELKIEKGKVVAVELRRKLIKISEEIQRDNEIQKE